MTDRRNISTEHQRSGDAARPSDTLDRGQTPAAPPADEEREEKAKRDAEKD